MRYPRLGNASAKLILVLILCAPAGPAYAQSRLHQFRGRNSTDAGPPSNSTSAAALQKVKIEPSAYLPFTPSTPKHIQIRTRSWVSFQGCSEVPSMRIKSPIVSVLRKVLLPVDYRSGPCIQSRLIFPVPGQLQRHLA